MNIQEWLLVATANLRDTNVPTARLDALILLEDTLQKDRGWLLAHIDEALTKATQKLLNQKIARRAQHVPLAYIRGKCEFYGREFIVSPAVLQPRPETEAMIDLLKKIVLTQRVGTSPELAVTTQAGPKYRSKKMLNEINTHPKLPSVIKIADVGAGSGALGITAQLEVKNAIVDLLEIDEEARAVAKNNVVLHTTSNTVIKTDLLAGSSGDYDILLCNLPYVPDDYAINDAARHEPALAIFGGNDGLDCYRRLFAQIGHLQKRPLYILCESLTSQHTILNVIAKQHEYELHMSEDLIQVFTFSKTQAQK